MENQGIDINLEKGGEERPRSYSSVAAFGTLGGQSALRRSVIYTEPHHEAPVSSQRPVTNVELEGARRNGIASGGTPGGGQSARRSVIYTEPHHEAAASSRRLVTKGELEGARRNSVVSCGTPGGGHSARRSVVFTASHLEAPASQQQAKKEELEIEKRDEEQEKMKANKEQLEFDKNIRLAENMDNFTTEGFVQWMGGRYKNYMETATNCEYLFALMERILKQERVFSAMDEKIKRIRSQIKLMEEKKTEELFHMVAICVSERAHQDFLEVSQIYSNFVNGVLGAKRSADGKYE